MSVLAVAFCEEKESSDYEDENEGLNLEHGRVLRAGCSEGQIYIYKRKICKKLHKQ